MSSLRADASLSSTSLLGSRVVFVVTYRRSKRILEAGSRNALFKKLARRVETPRDFNDEILIDSAIELVSK